MENVTRIKPGPHRPPRPPEEPIDVAPLAFEHLPESLRTKVFLGGVAVVVSAAVLIGGVLELGKMQREGVGKAPVPTQADYPSENPSHIPTSGNETGH